MSNYFDEMGWQPLGEGETPNHLLHLARLLLDYNMFEELGEHDRLPPPASKQAVEELETEEINEAGQQCPICLKEFECKQVAKKLGCSHKFHTECITPWLAKLILLETNSCPLCRFELPTDDERYELYRQEKKRAKEREKDLETLHNSMFS